VYVNHYNYETIIPEICLFEHKNICKMINFYGFGDYKLTLWRIKLDKADLWGMMCGMIGKICQNQNSTPI